MERLAQFNVRRHGCEVFPDIYFDETATQARVRC